MLKFLFFDNWGYETVEGFARELQRPAKDPRNPLLTPDRPWEFGNITLYGSVIKAPGRPYQLWYSVIEPRWFIHLAYAESEDGIHWLKPELDIFPFEGHRTNIVLSANVHGPAIIYDQADPRPDWAYKMLCGADPTSHVYAYHSADGIHWLRASEEPVIATNPDCPMALLRRPYWVARPYRDGRPGGVYAAHHRIPGGGRRIGRSESEDFIHWHGGRLVLEPGPGDPPQFQMYGMGAAPYGDYELGTLWDYTTDPQDTGRGKMCGCQETEFTYSRSGFAWHRPMPCQPFIPHGREGTWESGNLQAASAPLFLDDEIRYYYAASDVRHSHRWELNPGSFGIGMASTQPDRFIALVAGDDPGTITTRVFQIQTPEMRVNADIAAGGYVQIELLDADCRPIPGFERGSSTIRPRCPPLGGDALDHPLRWQGNPDPSPLLNRWIRWRLRATRARVYSVWMPDGDPLPRYDRFRSAF